MGTIASQITSLTIVYSTIYSTVDQRKHQRSASLAFVQGIHQGSVNSPHKWPVTRKMFPFDDVSCICRARHLTQQQHTPIIKDGVVGNTTWPHKNRVSWCYRALLLWKDEPTNNKETKGLLASKPPHYREDAPCIWEIPIQYRIVISSVKGNVFYFLKYDKLAA